MTSAATSAGLLAAEAASVLSAPDRRAVVIGMSKDPNAKLTVVLTPTRAGAGTLVVKIATTPVADDAVRREHDRLQGVRTLIHPTVRCTVPRPESLTEIGGRAALVVSGVPGTPLAVSYQRRRHTARPASVAADFDAVDRWLDRFHTGPAQGPAPVMGDAVAGVEARFGHLPGPTSAVLGSLEAAAARLAAAPDRGRPVHGDLWAGNLLLTSPGVVTGVVDWEAASLLGDPLRDVVRFASSYALYLDRRTGAGRPVAGHRGLRAGRWGAGLRYAVEGSGWFPDLFRSFLGRGLRRLGLTSDRWRDAVLVGLADVAATADHEEFARRHLELAAELSASGRGGAGERGRAC